MKRISRGGIRVDQVDSRGMSRRELIAALGLGAGAAVVVGACTVPAPTFDPPAPPPGAPEPGAFPDGVAAGDPLPGGSTIWTRVLAPVDGSPVGVVWSVASDADFTSIVAGGIAVADASAGHTVTVPVDGLAADSWFFYRFEVTGATAALSRTGRLRTAPAPGATPDRLRMAFASCQQINDSWFVAHRAAAAEPELDFFMHLGDYVYVSDTATQTVQDYRDTYRRWRGQPLLRDLHASVPMVTMWDDGEFYNGVDAGGPEARLANAKQAYFENFPIVDPGDRRLYRSLQWGGLADVPVIDVRAYRSPAIDDPVNLSPGGVNDPSRTTLGVEQLAWLKQVLASSTSTWRLIGSAYNLAPWRLLNLEFLRFFRPDLPQEPGVYAPNEAWDDYMAERRDLLQFLDTAGVRDTAFLSGHTHIYMTSELKPDVDRPGAPVVAYDFCTGSMTADPDPRTLLGELPSNVAEEVLRTAERWVLSQNAPMMRYMNFVNQGYTLVDATPDELIVTTRLIDPFDPTAPAYDAARFRLTPGSTKLERLPAARPTGSFN